MKGKVLQGVLIDAIEKEIRRVEVRPDEKGSYLESVKALLGLGELELVDVLRDKLAWLPSSPSDDIWVDDEMVDCPFAAAVHSEDLYIYGRGLILGWGPEGECESTSLLDDDIDALVNAVSFYTV